MSFEWTLPGPRVGFGVCFLFRSLPAHHPIRCVPPAAARHPPFGGNLPLPSPSLGSCAGTFRHRTLRLLAACTQEKQFVV